MTDHPREDQRRAGEPKHLRIPQAHRDKLTHPDLRRKKGAGPLPWYKLHSDLLLQDYAFWKLAETTQLHVLKLWALAFRGNDKPIPADDDYLQAQLRTTDIDVDGIVAAGFLEWVDPDEAPEVDAPSAEAEVLTDLQKTVRETLASGRSSVEVEPY